MTPPGVRTVFALRFEAGSFARRHPSLILGTCGAAAVSRFRDWAAKETREGLLVSAGFAGGLDPALAVGEVFLADNSSPALLDLIAKKGVGLPVRKLVTVDRILSTAADKALHHRDGDACDMESAGIAAICEAHGVGFLGVRAVSDSARGDLPVPAHLLQQTRPSHLLAFLLARPPRISGFIRMVRDASLARRRLHAALEKILDVLPDGGP